MTGTAPFSIVVDRQSFRIESPTLSGAQIKALVGKDLQHQVFLEGKGASADVAIADTQAVKLEPDMHFFTVPPAVFGL
jgi:hypothetical protein